MPNAQTSWKPPRRSRHWSNSGEREHEREDRRQRREHDSRAPWLARSPPGGSRSVEGAAGRAGRGVLVQHAEARRIERPPPAEPGQLGQERASCGHEQRDRLGQAGPRGRREAAGQVVDEERRVRLGIRPRRSVERDRRRGARPGRRPDRRPSFRYAARSPSSTAVRPRSHRRRCRWPWWPRCSSGGRPAGAARASRRVLASGRDGGRVVRRPMPGRRSVGQALQRAAVESSVAARGS